MADESLQSSCFVNCSCFTDASLAETEKIKKACDEAQSSNATLAKHVAQAEAECDRLLSEMETREHHHKEQVKAINQEHMKVSFLLHFFNNFSRLSCRLSWTRNMSMRPSSKLQ